jgi:8-oxo-dGTP pyrophosphatase MutT (NUDIX family)
MTAATGPRPASTVVLLRPSAARFEVFLVRRSDSVAFMGGAHVFPGGRVDPADQILDTRELTDGAESSAVRMSDVSLEEAIAHHVAALRELFEEAGVLLARRNGKIVTIDGDSHNRFTAHRHNLLAGTTSFADIVSAEGLRLAIDELTYFAHWVTPEVEIKRFDTRFFVARAPKGQTPVHDDGETIHSEWLDPAEAIERGRGEEIALPPPTWTTLRALAKFDSIDAVVRWARGKQIPRVQPGFLKRGDETLLLYPGDPLYPAIEGFEIPDETRFSLKNRRWRPVKPE